VDDGRGLRSIQPPHLVVGLDGGIEQSAIAAGLDETGKKVRIRRLCRTLDQGSRV